MSVNQNGGPAFPYAFQHEDDTRFIAQGFSPGMSLRDYFAAAALTGLLTDLSFPDTNDEVALARRIAGYAGCIADEMLAERAKKGTSA